MNGEDVKDFYEILRQKEIDCLRLRREVEALRIAAPLLDPDGSLAQEGYVTETLDEMIARERALTEHVAPAESVAAASLEET
ncbi:MAG TPA: hypothetical protein VK466_06755, partial [Terriglobales bacterium]|nr:hypothetical protein [Terriglobales bacterium]